MMFRACTSVYGKNASCNNPKIHFNALHTIRKFSLHALKISGPLHNVFNFPQGIYFRSLDICRGTGELRGTCLTRVHAKGAENSDIDLGGLGEQRKAMNSLLAYSVP